MTDQVGIPIDLRPEAYSTFYAKLGMCITFYQSIEDRLEAIFSVAMNGDNDRSEAIFAIVRGLEDKRKLISAAMLSRRPGEQELWNDLSKTIKDHADFRNKIAHIRLTIRGKGIIVSFNDDGEPIGAKSNGPPEMEGAKDTKSGTEIFKESHLSAEYVRLQLTSAKQVTLIQIMKAMPI